VESIDCRRSNAHRRLAGSARTLADRSNTREGAGLLVGKPVRGCAVRIIQSRPDCAIGPLSAEAFSNLCQPNGSAGEIVVSGEHVISGYADPARDRNSKIRVQNTVWHRTGDAGYFDESGRLWLVGRCAAALSDFRGTVYPFQVEYAVSAVRGVRRTALIEMDGDRVLVLQTAGREFRTHCGEAAKCVARFDIDRIVTMRSIPVDRRHDAKVDYPALTRLLEGRWRRYRDGIVEFISFVFTICRDGCKRLQHRH
jgi:acyl-CoA synthetase (AMP-forming)/AMP-acid ligase II